MHFNVICGEGLAAVQSRVHIGVRVAEGDGAVALQLLSNWETAHVAIDAGVPNWKWGICSHQYIDVTEQ